MSKNRYVNTEFWRDEYIENLDPFERYLYLYCITNPLTNVAGIYKISIKRIAFETGIEKNMALKMFNRFEIDGKIMYADGYLVCRNTIKHQKLNTNIIKGIYQIINECPFHLVKWMIGDALIEDQKTGKLLINFKSLSKPSNYLNININSNINSNSNINININKKNSENENDINQDINQFKENINQSKKNINQSEEKENEKQKKTEELKNDVNEIYKMYPSRCLVSFRSLQKNSNNKIKIHNLLKNKKFTVYQLKRVIQNYLDEYEDKNSNDFKPNMKNFSTFLNNLPDPKELNIPESEEAIIQEMIRDGWSREEIHI
jgi:hypothetical protein